MLKFGEREKESVDLYVVLYVNIAQLSVMTCENRLCNELSTVIINSRRALNRASMAPSVRKQSHNGDSTVRISKYPGHGDRPYYYIIGYRFKKVGLHSNTSYPGSAFAKELSRPVTNVGTGRSIRQQ